LDLNRRATLRPDFLSLEISDSTDGLVAQQHQWTVEAGGEHLDALVDAPGRHPRANVRIVQHLEPMADAVEQPRRIEHLKPRLEADPKSIGRGGRLDGAERHAFDDAGQLAELIRRID